MRCHFYQLVHPIRSGVKITEVQTGLLHVCTGGNYADKKPRKNFL